MGIDQEDLTPFDIAITIPQIDLSLPQGFDFRSQQGDPGLVGLFDKVVMKCLFVLTNQLLAHLSKSRIEHRADRIAKITHDRVIKGNMPSRILSIIL
jgi:hypothetical protein